jgi:hypothetical protein
MKLCSPGRTLRQTLSGSFTAFGLLLVIFVAKGWWIQRPPHPHAVGGEVHGFISAGISGQDLKTTVAVAKSVTIRVPNITLFLKDAGDGHVASKAISNAHGRYMLPRVPPGKYQLCWEAEGFQPGCDHDEIVIANETFTPTHDALIQPLPGVLVGRIQLADSKTCYQEDTLSGILAVTEVGLLDTAGNAVARPVFANSLGQYVLPKLPAPGKYQLVVKCADSKAQDVVNLTSANLAGVAPVNLTLKNHSPEIFGVSATKAGAFVTKASPGDTVDVKVEAHDVDGDALHYQWDDSSGSLISQDSASIQWKLPNSPANNLLFVRVTDNKGGFARGHFRITTSKTGTLFTGIVTEALNGVPITGATVNVNGATVTSNADPTKGVLGAFQIEVPDKNRYVLNVRKVGYALLSQVFAVGTTGLDLRLDRATHKICDPSTNCLIEIFCPPSRQDSTKAASTAAGVPIQGCTKEPAQVQIPANSLINVKTGLPAKTPVDVYGYRYDIARPNALPGSGELSATTSSGKDVSMVTFGALGIDITDAAGTHYNLKSCPRCAQASLSMPVVPIQTGVAPKAIPLWEYDEATGFWKQRSSATLIASRYVGKVPGFSVWNTDIEKVTGSCVRIDVAENNIPFPFKVHLVIPNPPNPVPEQRDFPATEEFNVLRRVPVNQRITLEIHPNSGPDVVLKTVHINTGNAATLFPPPPWTACQGFEQPNPGDPPPAGPRKVVLSLDLPTHNIPYLTIGTKGGQIIDPAAGVSLTTRTQVDAETSAYYVTSDPTAANGAGTVSSVAASVTVTGSGTSFTTFFHPGDIIRAGGAGGQVRTVDAIASDISLSTSTPFDPPIAAGTSFERVGIKTNLHDWKVQNGFPDPNPAGDEVSTIYYNNGDLQLGREMHCRPYPPAPGQSVACYVTNYGAPGGDSVSSLHDAVNGNNPVATVAMEYSPAGGTEGVKFYVFLQAGGAGGKRISFAILDSEGKKSIPQICLVCHGGSYNATAVMGGPPAHTVTGASFREFDVVTFLYDTGLFKRSNQEDQFRQLNQIVKNTNPNALNANHPITQVIDNLYGGHVDTPGTAAPADFASDAFFPTGADSWDGHGPLYRTIPRVYCRACHVAQSNYEDWTKFSQFHNYSQPVPGIGSTLGTRVCADRNMPHAEVPFKKFWFSTDPHGPAYLADPGTGVGFGAGACPP